jgi:hypothetical protein
MGSRSPKARVTSLALWAVVTGLGVFMLGRAVWALLQPWGSTAEELFALGFFTVLAALAGYQVIMAFSPTVPVIGGRLTEELAYGLVSLVFVVGALFVYFSGDGSASELLIALAGAVLFGMGAVVFFVRARRP